MVIKYNSAGKIIAHKFSMAQIEAAMEGYVGFCRACGAEQDGCEPDARRYKCETCGHMQVYGAEELVLMGQVNEAL
jgi:hypothetical protein